MEIHIQKNATVTLHRQLVTQISMQIAAGILQPGTRLPSLRGLSGKLGVHYNTVLSAYKELESIGLIEIRHGSGVRVAVNAPEKPDLQLPETAELETLAEFFIRQVNQRGYEWEHALAALENARQKASPADGSPLIFVDLHEDILPVFGMELQEALNRPVKTVSLDRFATDAAPEIKTQSGSHFVVSRYHCQALRSQLKAAGVAQPDERMTVVDVGSAQDELNLIKQLPEGALVVVASSSTIILRQAEAVVQALRGEDILIRTMLPGEDSMAVARVLKRATAIFADRTCHPELATLTRKPIHTIRAIPKREMEKLAAFRSQP